MIVNRAAIEVMENSMCRADSMPMVRIRSWKIATTAPRPNCSWKRNQMYSSIRAIAMPRASRPEYINSPDTLGPTTSTRLN